MTVVLPSRRRRIVISGKVVSKGLFVWSGVTKYRLDSSGCCCRIVDSER